MARQPLTRIHDHTQTLHTRWDSSGRGIRPLQRPQSDKTQHTRNRTAFYSIPISTSYCELEEEEEEEEEGKQQWQKEWEKRTNAAITKEYFPTVQERLSMNIRLFSFLYRARK